MGAWSGIFADRERMPLVIDGSHGEGGALASQEPESTPWRSADAGACRFDVAEARVTRRLARDGWTIETFGLASGDIAGAQGEPGIGTVTPFAHSL